MTREEAEKTPEWRWFSGNWDFGSFKTYIMKAIQVADGQNIEKLAKAFPREVEIYRIWMEG